MVVYFELKHREFYVLVTLNGRMYNASILPSVLFDQPLRNVVV